MKLPRDMLIKILEEVSIKQLFNYRSVCREWNYVIMNEIRLKELILYFQSFPYFEEFPTHPKPIKFKRSFKLSIDFHFLHTEFCKNLFKNLETLFLYDFSNRIETRIQMINIESLELFKKLKYLILFEISITNNRKMIYNLNLPNLEVLRLAQQFNLSNITLNSPKLIKLRTNCLIESFQSKYNSLKYLHCDVYDSSIKNLVNLEYLYVEEIDGLENDFLSNTKLPKLKELHIFKNVFALNQLIDQIEINQRTNLDLYFSGIKYRKEPNNLLLLNNLVSKYSLDNDNCLFYYLNYSNLADKISFISEIKYNEVVHCFGSIPNDFHDKFFSIYLCVIKNQIKNQFKLMKFLENSKSLTTIYLTHCSLEQKYYNRLPVICPFLIQLYIQESKININYQFILTLKNLLQFTTDQEIRIEFIEQIFNTCKQLDCLGFVNFKNEILIEKLDSIKYKLTIIFNPTGCRKYKTIDYKEDVIKNLKELLIKFR